MGGVNECSCGRQSEIVSRLQSWAIAAERFHWRPDVAICFLRTTCYLDDLSWQREEVDERDEGKFRPTSEEQIETRRNKRTRGRIHSWYSR